MFSVLFIQGGFEAIFGVGEIFLGVLCLRRFFLWNICEFGHFRLEKKSKNQNKASNPPLNGPSDDTACFTTRHVGYGWMLQRITG